MDTLPEWGSEPSNTEPTLTVISTTKYMNSGYSFGPHSLERPNGLNLESPKDRALPGWRIRLEVEMMAFHGKESKTV